MKMLALLTDGFGANGGIAQYNRDLMSALSQSQLIEQVVVLPRFGTCVASLPRKISQLMPNGGRLAWALHGAALAARGRFDVFFCGHLNAVPFVSALARLAGKPVWLQVHGIEAWASPSTIVRQATERSRLITSVSRYTRKRLLGWADIDPARVRVLPNTVAPVHVPTQRPMHLVEHYGLEGKRVILTVGRIAESERYKGHDHIIRAMPEVMKCVPNAIYLIVGTGDDIQRLKDISQQEGVAERVLFADHVSSDELPHYFSLANVFAMPSTGEGFGIVFLEAARSGLTVIGGNRDGSMDALADGEIGQLVDPDDPKQLVEALVAALTRGRPASAGSVDRFAFDNFSRHVDDLVRNFI